LPTWIANEDHGPSFPSQYWDTLSAAQQKITRKRLCQLTWQQLGLQQCRLLGVARDRALELISSGFVTLEEIVSIPRLPKPLLK
jgi:hypothetical protein